MAEALGTSTTTIRNWERGRNAPVMGPLVRRLAALMRVSPAKLLYGKEG
jgi:DNA-binding transcriptional regulator YiaG